MVTIPCPNDDELKQKYPLIPPGLAKGFLQVSNILKCLEEKMAPNLVNQDEIGVFRDRLAALGERIQRPRFKVGFVGRSGHGKSTAVANVLGVSTEESPCKPGTGAAATAVPTCVHAIARAKPHECSARPMTHNEYEERVKRICEFLFIPHDEAIIDQTLNRLLKPGAEDRLREIAGKRERGVDDVRFAIRYLRCLIDSKRVHGQKFLSQAAKPIDWNKRGDYTNHPDRGYERPHPEILMQEVLIGFSTDRIHDDLEIIDLPGVGTVNATDDLTTELYLPQLQGAVIFRKISEPNDQHTNLLLERLDDRFAGDMRQRVWICLTHCENLSQEFLYGTSTSSSPTTIFTRIADFVQSKAKLPFDNLTIISKSCFEKRNDLTSARHKSVSSFWPEDPPGNPQPPPSLERIDGLWPVFQQVFRDGGIERLREQIVTTLARRVRASEEDFVGKKMQAIKQELIELIKGAAERANMKNEEESLAAARAWKVVVEHARDQAATAIEQSAASLNSELTRILNDADIRRWTPGDLGQEHARLSQSLQRRGESFAKTEAVPELHRAISDEMERQRPSSARLPPVDGSSEGPIGAWQSLAARQLEQLPWSRHFATFANLPLTGTGRALAMELGTYEVLIKDKIRVTVESAYDDIALGISTYLNHICKQLDGFANPLDGLSRSAEDIVAICHELLEALEAVEI